MSKLNENINASITESQNAGKMWVLSKPKVNALSTFIGSNLWSALGITDFGKFIVGLTIYPFKIDCLKDNNNVDIEEPVVLGKTTTTVQGKKPLKSVSENITYILGEVTKTDDFTLYEPWSKYQLYIPFVGTIDLKAKDVLGKNIELTYVIDYLTGNAEVYVNSIDANSQTQKDKTVYHTTTVIGAVYPFGYDDLDNKITSTGIKLISKGILSKTSTPSSVKETTDINEGPMSKTVIESPTKQTSKSLNPATNRAFISGSMESAERKTETTQESRIIHKELERTPGKNGIDLNVNIGASGWASQGGSIASFGQPLTPYLIISKTDIQTIPSYGHLYGYPCYDEGLVSSFIGEGYIECSKVQLTGSPEVTEDEMNEINEWLVNGVIV